MKYGVPQENMHVSLLVVIYANKLFSIGAESNIASFADDMAFFNSNDGDELKATHAQFQKKLPCCSYDNYLLKYDTFSMELSKDNDNN